MPLRFDLGPFEKLFIGQSVLTNSHQRAIFVLEGDIPIMRSKDVLPLNSAQNALERLYHCVQQSYLEEALERYQGAYLVLTIQALEEAPDLDREIRTMDELIKSGEYYKALKVLRKRIRPEAFQEDRSQPARVKPSVSEREAKHRVAL